MEKFNLRADGPRISLPPEAVTLKLSADGQTWIDATLMDISSGGLKFRTDTDRQFKKGLMLEVDLEIRTQVQVFKKRLNGRVLRGERDTVSYKDYLQFQGMSSAEKVDLATFLELICTAQKSFGM